MTNFTIKTSASSIGLMTHLIAGYPSLDMSEQLAIKMSESGASILEIQIPFSDPIADGPIIARANVEALANGVKVSECIQMIKRLAKKISTPIVIMTYFNIVFKFGIEEFCKQASKGGARGIIIPDYPFDEEVDNGLISACKKHDLSFIPVIAPTTKAKRLREILKNGSGFIYCVARSGTTGNKTKIDQNVSEYLESVRKESDLPIAVGFGISSKDQIDALRPYANIAVIGSALVRAYQNKTKYNGLKNVEEYLLQLR